jgi:hypothetical protein
MDVLMSKVRSHIALRKKHMRCSICLLLGLYIRIVLDLSLRLLLPSAKLSSRAKQMVTNSKSTSTRSPFHAPQCHHLLAMKQPTQSSP